MSSALVSALKVSEFKPHDERASRFEFGLEYRSDLEKRSPGEGLRSDSREGEEGGRREGAHDRNDPSSVCFILRLQSLKTHSRSELLWCPQHVDEVQRAKIGLPRLWKRVKVGV